MTKSIFLQRYNSAMKIVYLDLAFLINFAADYLLCLCTARLCGLRMRRRRFALAALLGALYACAALFPSLPLLKTLPAKLLAALGIILAAFGSDARPGKCLLGFFLVSTAFGGFLYALGLGGSGRLVFSPKILLSSFLLFYGILRLWGCLRSRLDNSPRSEVRLSLNGRELCLRALVDSGNALSDPTSGDPVLVTSPTALRPLIGEYADLVESLGPVELLEVSAAIPALSGRLRLIPFRSLGGGGLLPAFRPDRIWIDGKESSSHLVALSPQACGDGYDAIL
jgi:stage II sporulation protein GA (sporulation sigma-E factor processing peptidase)